MICHRFCEKSDERLFYSKGSGGSIWNQEDHWTPICMDGYVRIAIVDAWDSTDQSEDAVVDDTNHRKKVDEWSDDIDEAIDEIAEDVECQVPSLIEFAQKASSNMHMKGHF